MRYLSLFSGIEAASVAWKPLGWTCVGVAEIAPFPCAVLKHHYPDVPNLGSVLGITGEMIAALGPIDLVVGGSPCQDLSVAGKRAGLVGERSSLFHQQIRIFHAARLLCGARWLVWENVPGAFSSHAGADFATVVGAMAGCSVVVPAKRWGTEGVALGKHGLVEWCVLDAQWFGVAQRRRRVFAVLDTGDWPNRPPILLERDSMRGDSAPSREAGKVASTIPVRSTGGGGANGPGRDVDPVESLQVVVQPFDVANCLTQRMSKGINSTVDEGQTPVLAVAHTLRGEGFDASEDGTGRGTPLVPVAFDTTQMSSAANYSNPKPGDPCHPLAAGAHPPAIAFMADDYKDGGYEEAETARPLTTSADRTRAAPIALSVSLRGREGGGTAEIGGEVQNCLRASGGGGDKPHVLAAMQVRRLTVKECARLQGFPDDYLSQVPWRGKPHPPDGPMYKALGDSMAVPVMRWIGRQITKARLI